MKVVSWEKIRKVMLACVSMAFLFPTFHTLKAQDFSVQLANGNTLYFSITDANKREVMVVPPNNSEGRDYYTGNSKPSGALSIPMEVRHDGIMYTVTAIGAGAFSGCTDLIMVMMPATIEHIEAYAFNGCSGLNERVTIGRNVKSIGNSAFYGCANLPEVRFQAENCEFMGGAMSSTVFGNCRNLKRVIIDEGVTRIPDYAFCGVDAIKSISTLPESLKYIGSYAFAYCSSLSGNLVIPDQVATVGECAFHQCHALKAVTIGNSVKTIGERAFYHCIGMKRVTLNTYIPPEIATTTFSDLSGQVTFSVPCVSKERYLRNEQWQPYAPFASSGQCRFTVNATLDNQVAGVIVGNGNYAYGDTVNLMAVCAVGYSFIGWSDGNTDNPRVFVMDDNITLTAKTSSTNTIAIHDTVYRIDTVYAEGYKVNHDTVDFVEETVSINDYKELTFDSNKKSLKWNFPREEEVVSVSVYNSEGSCIYMGDGRKGNVKMHRYPTGTYYVRVETIKRVIRCRFFMLAM